MKYSRLGRTSDVAERRGAPDGYLRRERFEGRRKRALAKPLGISQFGVNYTVLEPGAYSALRHWHEAEDEFIYVLDGKLTLVDDHGEHPLELGSFCAFPAGDENAHHLRNDSRKPATYIEIGSHRPGEDAVHYPDDGLGPIRR